jgi:hypothetical protein
MANQGGNGSNQDGQLAMGVDSNNILRAIKVGSDGGLSITAIGDPTDAAWDGVAASATVISLLKAIATNTAA